MKQISKHVYQIGLGAVNAFLIQGDDLTLVDTGYKGSEGKIFKALSKIGKKPTDLKRIVLTHAHPDHAGSVAAIKKASGAPLFMHSEDAALTREGIAGRIPHKVSPGFMNKLIFHFFIKKISNTLDAATVEEEVKEGDVLPIAGGMKVLHTPGHSRGHICLLLQEEGMLIAGDLCANIPTLGLSTLYEDLELGLASIGRVADLDFEAACFGHGGAIGKGATAKLRKKFTG